MNFKVDKPMAKLSFTVCDLNEVLCFLKCLLLHFKNLLNKVISFPITLNSLLPTVLLLIISLIDTRITSKSATCCSSKSCWTFDIEVILYLLERRLISAITVVFIITVIKLSQFTTRSHLCSSQRSIWGWSIGFSVFERRRSSILVSDGHQIVNYNPRVTASCEDLHDILIA